jgi:hypothetical protein
VRPEHFGPRNNGRSYQSVAEVEKRPPREGGKDTCKKRAYARASPSGLPCRSCAGNALWLALQARYDLQNDFIADAEVCYTMRAMPRFQACDDGVCEGVAVSIRPGDTICLTFYFVVL